MGTSDWTWMICWVQDKCPTYYIISLANQPLPNFLRTFSHHFFFLIAFVQLNCFASRSFSWGMVGEGVGMLFSQWLLFSTPFWASPCLPSSHTNCFSPGFSYTFTVCALPLLLFCILTAHSINSCSYLVFSIFMLKYKKIPKLCHCNSVFPEFLFTLKASKFWISESDRTRSRSSFTGLKLRNDDLYIYLICQLWQTSAAIKMMNFWSGR